MHGRLRFPVLFVSCGLLFALNACSNSMDSDDFQLTTSAANVSIAPGATKTISVTADAVTGAHSTVGITVSGTPGGVTVSPSAFKLNIGATQQVTISVASSATPADAIIIITGSSGSKIHETSVALAVTAPPAPADFTLSVMPATATLILGGTTHLTLQASAANGFSDPVAVAFSRLPAGVTAAPATVTLISGTAQSVTLTAGAGAAAGNATLTFTGTSGTLTHAASTNLTVVAPTAMDVTTYHYDNSRQGLNAKENILTPANVNAATFGKIGFYPADGKVDAQPLYVHGLSVASGAQAQTANVLYVATEHDSIYAFNTATGAQLWKTTLLSTDETTSDNLGCDQIAPEIGITATPVIDRKQGPNGAIFAIGMTKDASGTYHQRLHALDLGTGVELPGSPVEIQGTYPGTAAPNQNGNVIFDPTQYAARAGLLLLNGTIYVAWTSHCDFPPYNGWVMGYNESTLRQTTVLNLTPNGNGGSVWMSGYGLAADSDNIYLLVANGTFDTVLDANGFPSQGDYGNAMLKLGTKSGKLSVLDYFEAYNTVEESAADVDFGSGGAMLLPGITDNAGVVHHLVMGAGKDFNIYVADRDNLGKFNHTSADNHNIYQQLTDALPGQAFCGPAYFNGVVYYVGVSDAVKAFTITNGMLSTTPSSQSTSKFSYPGSAPTVSSSETQNGIVWALLSTENAPAVLHAYDASNLANELYNSDQAPDGRDSFGNGNKFITPVVVNGNVYVGTPQGVAVFGLLN